MKKWLKFMLLPMFATAFIFSLASCNNEYSANYKEVEDEEQINNIYDRIENLQTMESGASSGQSTYTKKATNYELVISSKTSLSASGQSFSYSNDVTSIDDYVNNITYIKFGVNTVGSGKESGTMTGFFEAWIDNTDNTAYLYFDCKGTGDAPTINKKVKGNVDSLGINDLKSYFSNSMAGDMSTELNLQTFLEKMTTSDTKVYIDGNKVKLVDENAYYKTELYLIINENSTYQIKLEIPYQEMAYYGSKMTMYQKMELKPTTKTAPSFNKTEFETYNGSFSDLMK